MFWIPKEEKTETTARGKEKSKFRDIFVRYKEKLYLCPEITPNKNFNQLHPTVTNSFQ